MGRSESLAVLNPNVFVYGLLRGLSTKLANKTQIESPRGLS